MVSLVSLAAVRLLDDDVVPIYTSAILTVTVKSLHSINRNTLFHISRKAILVGVLITDEITTRTAELTCDKISILGPFLHQIYE